MTAIQDKINSKVDFGTSQIQSIEDTLTLKGSVKCWIEEDGVKTLHHEKSNLIVNGARKALAHLISDANSIYKIDYFKLGTGGHAPGDILTPVSPTITDTDLEEPAFSKAIDHGNDTYLPTPPAETSVKFTVVVEKAEGNGSGTVAYCEAALFCNDNATMFARETFPAIVKNSTRRITFEWSILF
jgi:hypothetical protein